MPRMSRRDVKAGMILDRDVTNPRGQLLIASGTVLTEKHISALQLWGISLLHIRSSEDEQDAETAAPVSQEALERGRERARAAFAQNHERLTHPFFEALLPHVALRYAREEMGPQQPEMRPSPESAFMVGESRARTAGEMVKAVGTLGSLPMIYQELIQVVNHPLSSATDVANIISKDVGLTARLLRIVNSAFYGFPGQVETVSRATTIVGTNELCELALATSVMSVFDRSLRGVVNMSQFWLHSLFCGSVARMLGKFRGGANTERFFVIGLLHDIGRLVMFSEAPRRVREALDLAARSSRPVSDAERELFGFTHAAVGEALLSTWNIPPSHREAVRCHHGPMSGRELTADVCIAHVAEVVANAMRIGRSGDTEVPPMHVAAWDYLELKPEDLQAVIEEGETHVRDLAGIFGVLGP
ncbi:MAG: HDOD domain-containing protein [Candidatus Hydrogenedentales bacterium]|jgi:HD-like signal output (HDOD) protein